MIGSYSSGETCASSSGRRVRCPRPPSRAEGADAVVEEAQSRHSTGQLGHVPGITRLLCCPLDTPRRKINDAHQENPETAGSYRHRDRNHGRGPRRPCLRRKRIRRGAGRTDARQEPSISGSAREGQRLDADHGDWSGTGDIDYDYQWLRCNSDGDSCSAIGGANDDHYTLGSADVGNRLRVEVTATDSTGDSRRSRIGRTWSRRPGTAPANTSPPTISGVPQDNNRLTASTGSWSGSTPISYSFQWRRCDANGNNCGDIASGQNYTVTSHEVGSRLRVVVHGDQRRRLEHGHLRADERRACCRHRAEEHRGAVDTGTAKDGQTLTVNAGTWTGNTPIGFTYQWQRCDANGNGCQNIAGATAVSYKPSPRRHRAPASRRGHGEEPLRDDHCAHKRDSGRGRGWPGGRDQAARRRDHRSRSPASPCPTASSPTGCRSRRPRSTQSTSASPRVSTSSTRTGTSSATRSSTPPACPRTGSPSPARRRPTRPGGKHSSTHRSAACPSSAAPGSTLFVRARKPGENVLGGVSTRRLVSLGVHPFQ